MSKSFFTRSHMFTAAGVILTLLSFYFLFRRIDVNEFMITLKTYKPHSLLLLLVWSFLYAAIQGMRFGILQHSHLSLKQHIGLNFCNHAGNILLPARLGEVLRPFYIKRWQPDIAIKTLVTWTLFEKIGELLSMLLFIGLGLLAYHFELLEMPSLPWMMGIFFGFTAVVGYRQFRRRKEMSKARGIAWALFLSFATWLANSLGIYALTGNLSLSFAMIVTMTLAGALPLFPAGLGAAQWAFVALGSLVALSEAQALAYSTSVHLIWIFLRLCIGIPLLFSWGWPQAQALEKLRTAK